MKEPQATNGSASLCWWKLLLGPLLGVVLLVIGPGDDPTVARMAAVAVWMAAWWITEAVPIPVTALLPLVLMPLCGILGIKDVAPSYGKPTVYLFFGGFLLALGLEASGAHRRLALFIVHSIGGRPSRLVLGFMVSTAFLSMWISNTAAVMVMMPIGMAVLGAARDRGVEARDLKALGVTVMLGIAYAADIGGMATLVGTPPNLIYKQQLVQLFAGAPDPSFIQWTLVGLPISILFLASGWLILTRVVFRLPRGSLLGSREAVGEMRRQLGPIRRDEIMASSVFAAAALLWMTRAGIDLGSTHLPGWDELLGFQGGFVDDAVVAVTLALLMFVLPSASRPGEALLTWEMTKRLPWGMLLLFGGGFALAAGFKSSGLSVWVGHQLEGLAGLHPILLVMVICLILTFLTELTSNTATTQVVLPILATAGVAIGCDPRALMIPATLSASCAFMMPVASPTQAIVFGSGYVPIKDMVRAGIWFNLLGVLLVTLVFALLSGPVMGISFDILPAWATK
ncbi:MAG: SLC13 family permease [Planctomycetota bacterium]